MQTEKHFHLQAETRTVAELVEQVTKTLSVHFYGKRIGYLTKNEDEKVSFRFVESYLSMPNRPILSQSFEDQDLSQTYHATTLSSLPTFFANLIPEHGALRPLLESNLGIPPEDDFSLLEALGRDLPGAVEVFRVDEDLQTQEHLERPTKEQTSEDEKKINGSGLRFSLAGVQMKFSVIRDAEKITLPAHNQLGDWIVKLGSARFQLVVENEFAIMQWAKAAGFDVPEFSLEDASKVDISLREKIDFGKNVFVIRRYDRQAGGKIHQEDFAQVTNQKPKYKYDNISYEQCAGLVLQIIGHEAYDEWIRRLTFVIASGNADAHLKNWSLLYKDAEYPSLAPMYDQVCTVAWPDITSEFALHFANAKKNWFLLDLAHFKVLSKRAGAEPKKTIQRVKETLAHLIEVWNKAQIFEILPLSHTKSLQHFWSRVPLLSPFASEMRWPS